MSPNLLLLLLVFSFNVDICFKSQGVFDFSTFSSRVTSVLWKANDKLLMDGEVTEQADG